MRRTSTASRRGVAFVGHSFARADAMVVNRIKRAIRSSGYSVVTGEAPTPGGISEKVRARIETANVFVAVLTRRHRIADAHWTTSPWVIEEKAYAFGRSPTRPIVLLVEEGIVVPGEVGGINGDLEYVMFDRYRLDLAQAKLRVMLETLP